MRFITNIDKDKYELFVETNKEKSHFLQSSLWGEFSHLEKNLKPHYVGLVDEDNNLLCSALLLEKKLILGYSYFYSPRGYVMDFNDDILLSKFTHEIKKYAKKNKAIFVKIDPDIIINKYNCNDEKLYVSKSHELVFNNLKKLGYKHLGFTKKFETTQPRFTFRIDFDKSLEEVENNFSKTTKQRIKKAEYLDVKVDIASNVEEFFKLMSITESRKDFVTHDINYYKKLYEIFSVKEKCNIFLGSININNIIEKLNKDIDVIDSELNEMNVLESLSKSSKVKINELVKRKEKIEEDISKYKEELEKYGSEIILSAHFIVEYGDKAWVLYAGNHDILSYTYTNYKTYLEHIRYYYNKGVRVYDQFGTVGDIEETDHLMGLHEFKKKFGGDYIEFMGEFDLITNKFMYIIFLKLIPVYRNIKYRINKK